MIIKDSLNACIDSTEKKIDIYNLELNLGSDTTICGNSFLIQAQSTADLLWLNDSSTLSAYHVTQDENVILKASLGNCVVHDSIYVAIEKKLNGGFNISNICENDTLVFQDTTNNSTINNRIWILDGYQLASDSANVEIQNASIGIHNISMIINNNAGCSDTINKNFTIQEKPDINLTGYIQICGNQYQANITPPNGSQILWSNGNTSNTPIFNQSGTHSVVVNYNGCINQDSFQLNLKPKPQAVIDAHDICEGDNLQLLNNSTGTILFNKWDFNNGVTSTTLNPNITYNNPGSYNIELIVKALNNCSDTTYKLIKVDKRPILNLGNDTTICSNQMVLDCGVINANYLWSNSSNDEAITISNSGIYSVTVDSGNCSVSDDINVVLNSNPQALIGINGICTNDSIVIFSNSIYTSPLTQYSWSINNQTYLGDTIRPIINNEQSLNIELTIIDQNSCMDSVSINTFIYAPDFSSIWTSGDTSIYVGEELSIHAYGAYDYEWFPKENLDTPYEDHTIASPNQKQRYVVMAKDINGCTIYDSLIVDIKPNSQIYIPDAFTPNHDGNNDFYYLSGENICSINYSIYNRWGNVVFKANNINDKWDGRYKDKAQGSEGYTVFGNINFCDGSKQVIKKRIHLLN
jgi:gliding motility-associated-like protein